MNQFCQIQSQFQVKFCQNFVCANSILINSSMLFTNYLDNLKIKMGNSESKFDDIVLSNQQIQDWFISQSQGGCELWINKKTGRKFQAYPMPQSAIMNPQQLQKYAFRKNHAAYIVAVEGVLKQADAFLCSHVSSSYVLTENITSRLGEYRGALTFQQALYVLFAAANGYNTLASFFGPLQPSEDTICINQAGYVKVWLNENLALNDPSPSATGSYKSGAKQPRRNQDQNVIKNRVKQCVSKLFDVVEKATQGFPTRFREESRHLSTFFQAVNFVQHFSQVNGIRIPDHVSRIPNQQITRESEGYALSGVAIQQFSRCSVNNTASQEKTQNLATSRINYVYKSNYANESPNQAQQSTYSTSRDRIVSFPTTIPNKIAFQLKPANPFQQTQNLAPQHVIGFARVSTPVNLQKINFPAPTVTYQPISQAPAIFQIPVENKSNTIKPIQVQKKQNKKQDTVTTESSRMPNSYKIDVKRTVSLEQTIFQPKINYKQENYLERDPFACPKQDVSQPYNESDDIQQTQFAFQNQLQIYQQFKNKQKTSQSQRNQYRIDEFQEDSQNQIEQNFISKSVQKNHQKPIVKQQENTSQNIQLYSPKSNVNRIPIHNKYYRSPILEQDQNFSPSNQKNAQIDEWEKRLDKMSVSARQIFPTESKKEDQSSKAYMNIINPHKVDSNQIQHKQIKHQFGNNANELGTEDLQKYVRAKYLSKKQDQPVSNQLKNYSDKAYKQATSDNKQSFDFKSQLQNWKRENQIYSKFEPEYEPLREIKSSDTQPYKTVDFKSSVNSTANKLQLNNRSTKEQTYSKSLSYPLGSLQQQSHRQDYISQKPNDRKRNRANDTTKIDQKYSKYVLNSQKSKPITSMNKEKVVSKQILDKNLPIKKSNINQLNVNQKSSKNVRLRSESSDKQHVSYGKLTTLLWQE